MTQQKQIWELQHPTICKVVGMALDLEDLKRIFRKFGLRNRDSYVDEEFALHSTVVRLCSEESRASRHVQKLIEKRFLPYELRLASFEARDITGSFLRGCAAGGIPLWAALWYCATRSLPYWEKVQRSLFGLIHMLEHRLVKDFWKKAATAEAGGETEPKDEIDTLRRELIKLRSSHTRLVRQNQRLAASVARSGCGASSSSAPTTDPPRGSTFQNRKIERLKVLLEEERKKNRELEEEHSVSKRQIEALTQELVSHENADVPSREKSAEGPCPCSLRQRLQGRRIALVGGIDSLDVHYRSLVEQSGGEFCRHDGKCTRGERKLEECIRSADLVVCPVGVNSHFGALAVKKVCKRYGIRCCFPESAGLGSLRSALVQHLPPGTGIAEGSV